LKFRGQLNEFITKFGGTDVSVHAELLIAAHIKIKHDFLEVFIVVGNATFHLNVFL